MSVLSPSSVNSLVHLRIAAAGARGISISKLLADLRLFRPAPVEFVGQVKEKTALNKLAWIGDQYVSTLATQKVGEFCVADAKEVRRFKGQVSVVQTTQQSETSIVAYAREGRRN